MIALRFIAIIALMPPAVYAVMWFALKVVSPWANSFN
jgi:hypothetical protein